MVASSPLAIQTQWPRPHSVSESEGASQLALNTQLPYNQPLSTTSSPTNTASDSEDNNSKRYNPSDKVPCPHPNCDTVLSKKALARHMSNKHDQHSDKKVAKQAQYRCQFCTENNTEKWVAWTGRPKHYRKWHPSAKPGTWPITEWYRPDYESHAYWRQDCSPGPGVAEENEPMDKPMTIPCNHSLETDHQPLSATTSPRNLASQSSQGASGEQKQDLDPPIQHSHQVQEKRQSPANLFKKPRLVVRAHNDGDNTLTSSNESIECQPYIAPVTASSPKHYAQVSQLHRAATDDAQPFPLVDWIKEIRTDTFKRSPILPIKWASSISKRQQAILDSHDTWLPPLAGKPLRPGSVPLDLLQRLTKKADDRATVQARAEPETGRDGYAEATTLVDLSKPQSPYQDPAPQSSPEDELDGHSEKATVEASQWSSSPPPPRLPPDSDAMTELYQPMKNKPQVDQVQLETIDEADSPSQIGQLEEPLDASGRQPSQERSGPEASSHPTTEHAHQVVADDAASYRPDAHPTSAADHSIEILADCLTEPQTVRAKPVTKVQVKDTPYPAKEIQKASKPNILPDDAPQSSFVGATYPDLPSTQPCKEPNQAQSVVFTEEAEARHSPPALRTLKRPINREGDEDGVSQTERASLNGKDAMSANTVTIDARASQSTNSTPVSFHEAVPARKRQKLEQKATVERPLNVRLSGYRQYDNQRMLDRRRFLRSISTSWTNAGPEDPETFLRHNNQAHAKTSSQASSPPVSAKHSNAAGSEGIDTSATNLSIHESHMPKTPVRRPGSRMSSFNVDMDDHCLASTFSTFQHAYPDYRGNQKSFRSALQLLLRLQSQPREPHPSMWDDFIFRKAQDYKQYLAECIDNDESAIEYQDYYYARVRRSERAKEVVTEDVLQNLAESARPDRMHVPGSRLRYSRSTSSFRVTNDVEMRDVRRPSAELIRDRQQTQETELPRTQDRPSLPAGVEDKRKKTDDCEIPETQAVPAEQRAPRPRHSLPSQPTVAQPAPEITRSAAKKRQSLPWDATRNNTVAESSRVPLQRITNNTSSTQCSKSSKVEEWLLTSRAAGAASPEIEAMELPTLERDTRKPTPSYRNEVSPLRLQANVVTAVADIARWIEPSVATPSGTPKFVRQPETKFSSFVANYAQLQSEKAFHSLPAKKRRIPINIYEW